MELAHLPARIAKLLKNPEITWRIAQTAQEKAGAKYRWFNRAGEILRIVTGYKKAYNIY